MSNLFGPVRQTAYVVGDIEAAMAWWTRVMHVGPFFLLKRHVAVGATFRGEPTNMCISLAFAQSGSMQIELVQQHDEAPSLFREFIDAGREGVQHVAFWTETFDEDIARYVDAGYKVVQTAGLGGASNRNAFIEKVGESIGATGDGIPRVAIEISEIKGSKGVFFRKIADAAENWDGTDPVRVA